MYTFASLQRFVGVAITCTQKLAKHDSTHRHIYPRMVGQKQFGKEVYATMHTHTQTHTSYMQIQIHANTEPIHQTHLRPC